MSSEQKCNSAAVSHPSFQGSPVHFASMSGVSHRSFERQWKRETGVVWGQLTAPPRGVSDVDDDTADGVGQTLVLMDEGKLLWDSGMSQSSGFWDAAKNVLQGRVNICIVVAAPYASEVQGLTDDSPPPPHIEGLESVSLW